MMLIKDIIKPAGEDDSGIVETVISEPSDALSTKGILMTLDAQEETPKPLNNLQVQLSPLKPFGRPSIDKECQTDPKLAPAGIKIEAVSAFQFKRKLCDLLVQRNDTIAKVKSLITD